MENDLERATAEDAFLTFRGADWYMASHGGTVQHLVASVSPTNRLWKTKCGKELRLGKAATGGLGMNTCRGCRDHLKGKKA